MRIFSDLSEQKFERFQHENMDPALQLIGDGLRKRLA